MTDRNSKQFKERNGALDLIRIVACLGILYLHFRSYVSPGGVYWGDVLVTADNSGVDLRCFVEIFFVMSGYLMYSYVKRISEGMGFGEYFCPKLWRILPLLAVATVVYQLLAHNLLMLGADVSYSQSSLWGMLSSAFGVQEGWSFINSHINPEAWFLDVLLLCYLFTYIIVNICNRFGVDNRWGFGIMIFLGAACVSRESELPFLGYMAGRGYESYFAGMMLAAFLNKKSAGKKEYLISFLILIVYALYHVFRPELLVFGKFYLVAFLVAPALIVIAQIPAVRKVFSWKGLAAAGKVTFATYVFHTCTLLGIRNLAEYFGVTIDYGHEVMLIAYIICAFVVGTLAYLLVERPVINLRNKSQKTERN